MFKIFTLVEQVKFKKLMYIKALFFFETEKCKFKFPVWVFLAKF